MAGPLQLRPAIASPPARRLYERLGFRVVGSSETAHKMLWEA